MCERPDARVVKSRDSFFTVLAAVISEDDYNLSIRSADLCKKANKGRATFFRRYRQVGDIFRLRDEEIWVAFSKLDFAGLEKKLIWRKLLLFLVKHKEEFVFKFSYDRDKLFRRMIFSIRHDVAFNLECYDPELSLYLFEIFYANVCGILKVWIESGMGVEKIDWIAKYLAHTAGNMSGNMAKTIAEVFRQ